MKIVLFCSVYHYTVFFLCASARKQSKMYTGGFKTLTELAASVSQHIKESKQTKMSLRR